MKELSPSSFLLVPANPKLACYAEEFASREAAEDAQDEYADRGLDYDVVAVYG
jgi:hypothetical protein